MMPGAPDVEAQVRSHARFTKKRDALEASSNEGVSGCGGVPVDGGNNTAMPEEELVGQRFALMLSGLRCLGSNRPRIRATELTGRVGRMGSMRPSVPSPS